MALSVDRELNDVLVFLAVVDEGSFTAAGKALRMPTSTVSRRVARLEATLDTRLLQRTTRKLSLTDAGRVYHEHARRAFEQLEAAELQLADAHDTPRGRVRMTAPIEHQVTMAVLIDFLTKHPAVEVEVEFSSRSVNILEEGFDVGLSAGPLSSESIVAHRLMDSTASVVASPAYLEARGRPETPADLSEHPCVVFGHFRGARDWVFSNAGETIVAQVAGPLVVNHLAAARDAAVGGLGLARLPVITVGRDVAAGRLVVVLEDYEPPPIPVWVSHAAGPYQPPAIRALVTHLRENFMVFAVPNAGETGLNPP